MTEKVIYALKREEYEGYITQIFQNRSCALDYLYTFLKDKDPEVYLTTFSYLCEYFSILYQFENLLEDVTVASTWDASHERWIVEEAMALSMVVHVHALHTCTKELLNHNISFSLH